MLERLPSEVGMVTPSECFVGTCSEGSVSVVGIMPGVFARVTCWCLHGAVHIWDGAVGVDEVWFVVAVVGAMFSAVVPIYFSNCCNAFSVASLVGLVFFSDLFYCKGKCCWYLFCCFHRCFSWYWAMFGLKCRLYICLVSACWGYVEFQGSLVLIGWAGILCTNGPWSPSCSYFWWVEDFCATAGRSKRDSVNIMRAFQTWYADSLGCIFEVLIIFNAACASFLSL